MGSRGKDPFNFDDIYKQAGVDNLFVKKSMADMKKPAAPAGPVKPMESPRTQPPTDNIPAAYNTSAPTRVTASSGISAAVKPGGDPFASLSVVKPSIQPMGAKKASQDPITNTSAANSPRVEPAGMPATTPVVTGFDLDDMFGVGGSASTKAPAPMSADPFAAFDSIDGALPATSHHPASADRILDLDDGLGAPPSAPNSRPASTQPSPRPTPTPAAYSAPSQPPAYEQPRPSPRTQVAPAPPAYNAPEPAPRPAPKSGASYFSQYGDAPAPNPTLEETYSDPPSLSEVHRQRTSSDDGLRERPHSGSSRSGLKGLLKTGAALGKKALRAAKDGLHSMESYLEKLEDNNSGRSRPPYPTDASSSQFSDDDVMTLAVRVSELPSYKQEDALAALPRDVRLRIAQLIRQQAIAEGGDAPGPSQFGAPPTAASRPAEVISTSEFKLSDSDDDEDTAAAENKPTVRVHIKPASAAPSPHQQRPVAPVEDDLLGISSSSTSAPVAPRPSPRPTAAPAPRPVEDDLLGISSTAVATPAAPKPSPRPAAAPAEDDLLGFSAPAAAAPPAAAAVPHDPQDVSDFFSGGSAPSSAQPSPRPAPVPARAAAAATPASPSKHMDDFFSGGDAAPAPSRAAPPRAAVPKPASTSALDALGGLGGGDYEDDDVGDENEPEIRKQLRARRLAERAARMQAALEDKQSKEVEEARRREEQVHLKEKLAEPIMAWKNKNKGNIRGLIGSLQTVLWEGSGWKPIGMGDLLEPGQVRKAWMKANLLVHPDKVRQRNGTPEQLAVADMIFDVLKEAMTQFK